MVTVKRKINNETERYGGFSEIDVRTPEDVGSSYMQAQVKQAEASVKYTTPPRTTHDIKPDRTTTTVPPSTTPSPGEYMMNIQTKKEPERRVEEKKKQNMDSRTKLILGVYLAIIVLLSALVIASGVFLSSTGSKVDALQNEIEAKNAYITEQLSELSVLNDEDAITGRAYNKGMERIEDSESIDLLPIGDVQTYEGTTNWFDSFCDWLSGVFGG